MSNRKNDLMRAVTLLELTPPFSILDIKNAYKKLAKDLHPDRNPSGKGRKTSMETVNWAYQTLLKHVEQVRIPLPLLISSAKTEEERLKERFFYDWIPPDRRKEDKA